MLRCDCGGQTIVVDSRDYGTYLRRRRLCRSCKKRHTTYERVAVEDSEILFYRKAYPHDHRTDDQIKESIKSLEGKSTEQIRYWVISRGGIK